MWIPCFIPLYSPLNLYLIILWILDSKYILLLLLYYYYYYYYYYYNMLYFIPYLYYDDSVKLKSDN